MFTKEMIEYTAYVYLRTLSLNSVVDIIRAWFHKDVLSKDLLYEHIIKLIDTLPSFWEITILFHPNRSGYYAWDGTWFTYRGQQRVLLVCFDTVTLDIVGYHVAKDENYETYGQLMGMIEKTEGNLFSTAKGFFSDGELGLLKQFKDRYHYVPVQLCAFHKYSRIGQIVPFVRSDSIGKEIKQRVERVIFAETKPDAISALSDLKRYAGEHQENAKLRKVIGVLKRNFELLLTHFDHPEMSPYNNVLEGFNHIIKRRIRLMKGFKEETNIDRWLRLLLIDYRFHTIKESKFSDRNGKSPLELSGVKLEKYHNWMTLIRRKYNVRS